MFLVALARGRHRVTRRDLVVAVPMLLLALWAVRNVAVAPLIGLPVVARAFARDEEKPSELRAARSSAAAITVLVLAAVAMGYQATTEKTFDFSTYPVSSMRYLERHDLLGTRLLTTDAAAGYVILEHFPEQKVFIDDRYDMYPTSVIFDYFTLTGGKPGWSKVLDRYDVDVIVWGKDSSLAALLDQSPDWQRVHRDATDAVWVRAGSLPDGFTPRGSRGGRRASAAGADAEVVVAFHDEERAQLGALDHCLDAVVTRRFRGERRVRPAARGRRGRTSTNPMVTISRASDDAGTREDARRHAEPDVRVPRRRSRRRSSLRAVAARTRTPSIGNSSSDGGRQS